MLVEQKARKLRGGRLTVAGVLVLDLMDHLRPRARLVGNDGRPEVEAVWGPRPRVRRHFAARQTLHDRVVPVARVCEPCPAGAAPRRGHSRAADEAHHPHTAFEKRMPACTSSAFQDHEGQQGEEREEGT